MGSIMVVKSLFCLYYLLYWLIISELIVEALLFQMLKLLFFQSFLRNICLLSCLCDLFVELLRLFPCFLSNVVQE